MILNVSDDYLVLFLLIDGNAATQSDQEYEHCKNYDQEYNPRRKKRDTISIGAAQGLTDTVITTASSRTEVLVFILLPSSHLIVVEAIL